MDQVIIEVMKDSGRRADYKVFNSLVIRIGRGYGNDLIVTDPFVSERHCVIRSQESGFLIEDLSSLNGTWLQSFAAQKNAAQTKGLKNWILNIFRRGKKADESKQKVAASLPLHSGDHILIGQTRLRFFVPSHEVEPARLIVKPNAFFEAISRSWRAWGLVAVAMLFSVVIEHQESYKNLSVSKFISVGIGLLLVLLVWVGIWSFIGWLVKRKAFFNAHLSWATLFFLVTTLTYPVSEHLGYAASSPTFEMIVGSAVFWVSITALIAGHLVIATFIPRIYQILWAGLISMVIVVFGIVTYYAGQSEFNPQPDLYATLIPPYGRLGPSQSIDQFLQDNSRVFSIKTNGH